MTVTARPGLPLDVAWQQAIAHHQAGRLHEAEQLYRAILQVQPDHPDSNHNLGIIAGQMGQHAAGLPYLQRALAGNPEHEQFVLSLADALFAMGQTEDALGILESARKRGIDSAATQGLRQKAHTALLYKQANGDGPSPIEIDQLITLFNSGQYGEVEKRGGKLLERYPNSGFVWNVLGACLGQQGKDALPALRNAAKYLPLDAEVHNNLGASLQSRHQPADAIISFSRALEINPDYAAAHYNLGVAQKDLGKHNDAVASFHRVLAIQPDFAEAHVNLGNLLHVLGQSDLAVQSFRRALEIRPKDADLYVDLGSALQALGRFNEAIVSFQYALQINARYAEAHNNLGIAFRELGQLDNAMASLRRALEIKPNFAEAHFNLGNVQRSINQLDHAVASFRRALELNPDLAQAHCNLGNALQEFGRFDEALACSRRALEIKPDYADGYGNLLFVLSHHPNIDSKVLFAEYCRFGEQFESPLSIHWALHNNVRDPERSLQIGFVSGDLRNHAVAFLVEPVLTHLAKSNRLSLHAYHNYGAEDDVTRRLKGLMTHWHPIAGLSDEALAQKIRADGIDILIDLSGHTNHNRLLTFARKPAPVQASWVGYPGTTGLRSMDYYLADRFFLPVERFADQFTEKIVYLPSATTFLPFADAPAINALPVLNNGYMTFGSFNRLSKINRSVIALWAQLLRAVPNSRMLLGSLAEGAQRENLLTWFTDEGIAHERLFLHPRRDMATYLGLHHQVDLCLDTFPYTGGTTTCHALWMGVPTLTLAGNTPFGRDGAGLLGGLGLEAFVAHDHDDFVRKGVAWAGQLDALAAIRSQLRERIAHSPLGQPGLVADGLEQALRTMWRRWCNGLPVEHF